MLSLIKWKNILDSCKYRIDRACLPVLMIYNRSTHYPRIANDPENNVHLCGSWEQIVGDLDTFGK